MTNDELRKKIKNLCNLAYKKEKDKKEKFIKEVDDKLKEFYDLRMAFNKLEKKNKELEAKMKKIWIEAEHLIICELAIDQSKDEVIRKLRDQVTILLKGE